MGSTGPLPMPFEIGRYGPIFRLILTRLGATQWSDGSGPLFGHASLMASCLNLLSPLLVVERFSGCNRHASSSIPAPIGTRPPSHINRLNQLALVFVRDRDQVIDAALPPATAPSPTLDFVRVDGMAATP